MSIPDGFKVSEVGVIPEDWDVKRLGDIADVKTGPFGSSLHEKDYVDDGTPIITVEHLSDKGVVHKNLPMVSDYDKNRLSSYILKTGDIVFSRVGSVDRNSLIRNLEDGWLFSSRLLRIRINNKNIAPAYLSYHFLQESTKQRIRSVAVGQTMASLNTAILKGIEITLPPLAEQKAIAQSLSDVDNLITAIDKLITKKRNIKQGTMQELLTGKKRLPGFTGEWEVKKLGDILKVRHGKSQHDVVNENGEFPILATSGEIGKANTYLYNKPSVLIGRKGTIDIPQYMDTPFWTIDTLFYTEIFNNTVPKFVFYRFHLISWYSYNEASGVPSLSAKTIENIEINYPKSFEEQKAIAKILTEMDEEIEALEKKREKYKNIKQGMMQELLTGKTRIIDN
ncbi:restriction endonuclease subunit S [Sphaerospermopsis kisseleviana CS-549]|uniref:Restriction endonuclease subunit S n=1 Tax=Sphaerospermopsis kisseleviana CS-549 TaxID=3021783 RepID=A0ABT4ZXW5_9CYAN|nr:restriction endonuclease subunit S [Sphaerospermopsis kisseleviana]MDB9443512.1 restriction endonuclease subunit S [Sphaerospermopsis kisseleviana CS-549]BAZ80661.1 type I restriction-modification enzyme S subunit [Sphaerospermopsis kisseleviana NIES-73]